LITENCQHGLLELLGRQFAFVAFPLVTIAAKYRTSYNYFMAGFEIFRVRARVLFAKFSKQAGCPAPIDGKQ